MKGFIHSAYVVSAAIFLAITMLTYLVRRFLFRQFLKLASNTETKIDDIIVSELKAPVILWGILAGMFFAVRYYSPAEKYLLLINKTLLVLLIISITYFLARLLGRVLREYEKTASEKMHMTSLMQSVINLVFFSVGFLVILNVLGVSIAPVITALGIGGIAIGLALQDTLSNLFSGMYLIVARQIKVGDYIKLESGQEGYVQDIGWRATRIRTLPNNMVIVPNLKMSQTIVTNYYTDGKEMAVLVQVGVSYSSDLEKVEKVTISAAEEIMKEIKGGIPSFKPFIRYHTFGDFSIGFTVILRCAEFVDQYLIKHEFVKRLHTRYRSENIEIPFPVRTVLTKKGE